MTAGRRAKPRLFLGRRDGRDSAFTGEGSLLTIGPPGTGKSRGVAIWNLLDYPGSMLVTDPKGQLAQWSARHREEKFGHRIAILDPFGITGEDSVSVNPLEPLRRTVEQGRGYRTEAQRIATMLLPDAPGDKDPFWRGGARQMIAAGLLYLAALRPAQCDLPGLYDFLWEGERAFAEKIVPEMGGSDALEGTLRRYADDLTTLIGDRAKHFGSFRDEARQALSIFGPKEPCGEACRASEIDFTWLIEGRLTVYLVLPPQYVASHGRWMGVVAAHAIHAIMGAQGFGECVFLLDEFPNLGKLPGIVQAIAQLREKGLRVWIFVQDLAQLRSLYGEHEAQAIQRQAEVLQALGCQDPELADYIERRAGEKTIQTRSWDLPSRLDPASMPQEKISEQGFPNLPAAAVMGLPEGRQVLVRRHYPVVVADIVIWEGP